MDYEQKFQEFSGLVLREASEQKQRLLKEVKSKIDQAQENIRQDMIDQAEQELKAETEKAVRKKNEELSKAAMQARKTLIQTREQLIGKMYDSVLDKLNDFTKSDDYFSFLVNNIKEAKQELNDENVVVYIGSGDKALIEKLEQTTKVKVEIEDSINIGGCKVISPAKRMLVDATLQKRLDEQFASFDKLAIRN